jgi:lysozyme family protein
MNIIELAINHTFGVEGGKANVKNDKGGATNMGVTQATYNEYLAKKKLPRREVFTMTRKEAVEIYTDFWKQAKCNELPPIIAVVHFDTAINFGPTGAAKLLQRLARVPVDGIIGPQTIAKVKAMSEGNHFITAVRYCQLLCDVRDEIVEDDKSQAGFLVGWKNRDEKTLKFVLSLQKSLA